MNQVLDSLEKNQNGFLIEKTKFLLTHPLKAGLSKIWFKGTLQQDKKKSEQLGH